MNTFPVYVTRIVVPFDGDGHGHVNATRQGYGGKRVQKVSVEPRVELIFQVKDGRNVDRNTA